MIADFNTMSMMFSECNKKYFNHESEGFNIIEEKNKDII